jgi:hypothetical protein
MNPLSISERTLLLEYLEAADIHCRFLSYCVENVLDSSFQTLCKVQKTHTEEMSVTLAQFLGDTQADWEGGKIYGTRNFPM